MCHLDFTGGATHQRKRVISFTAWSLSQLDFHIEKFCKSYTNLRENETL